MADFKTLDNEILEFAESFINAVREPLIVLDHDLRVISASRSFYDVFKVKPEETLGQFIYDLGSKQWDIPELRQLLETLLPQKATLDGYEIEHEFTDIGKRTILLNAREIPRKSGKERLILFAVEDITERKRQKNLLSESEERYRRFFETANDGMVLLEKAEGKITHANPAIKELLGYSPDELIGKRLIDIGFPGDIGTIEEIFQTLEKDGILHYKDAPVQTWSAQVIYTDIYMIDKARLVQCNIRDITERKRSAAAIENERVYLSDVIDNIGEAIVICDAEGRIARFNETARRLHGLPEESVLPDQWAEHYSLYQQDGITPLPTEDIPLYRALQGERVQNAEIVVAPKHSRPYDLVCSGQALTDETGKITGAVVAMHDITRRKQIEDALRASEEKYRSILDKIEDGYFEVDLAGNFTFFNDSMCRILGYSSDELLGMNNRAFMDTENADKVYKAFNQVFTSGKPLKAFDWELITKDGERCYVDTSVSLIKNANGEAIGFRGIARDITERKQAESYREMGREILQVLNEPGDLQESIQRVLATLKTRTGVDAVGLRLQEGEDFPYFAQDGFSRDFLLTENTLVERGKDGGVCRDKDGNVHLECTCGLVISGKTDPSNPLFTKGGSSWTNHSFPFLDLPSDQDPRLHPRNNCIHQGYASVALIPIRIQDQMYSRETSIRHGFSSMAQVPVRTSGQIVGLIQFNDKRKGRFTLETIEILEGIAAHIGSALMRKRAEAEREKLQAQLNQAQKMESVGRLAGGVAHDFNNKLTIINGYAEMAIEMMEPSNPLYKPIREILTAGIKSAAIVRQLLAFARKQTISPVQLDLNETLSKMLEMLQRLIGENIDLTWLPCKNLWSVKIDPSQVDQIMANLAVNARDAISDVGKLTIETKNTIVDEDFCKTNPEAIPGRYVMLSVSDDGSGMDKETFGNLFEPFFTTKEIGKGTGLGLATVYGIVKQNNGFINVYSELGKGTTLKIYLPRNEGEELSLKSAIKSPGQVPTGTETILVVEDDKGVLHMSMRILQRLGYTVQIAENPYEALKLSEAYEGTIHLLLTDVVMPEMNGRDLASKMTMSRPELKTLYMSSYTANEIAHTGVLDPGVLFIHKPLSMQELAAKLREAIEQE